MKSIHLVEGSVAKTGRQFLPIFCNTDGHQPVTAPCDDWLAKHFRIDPEVRTELLGGGVLQVKGHLSSSMYEGSYYLESPTVS